MIRYLNQFSRPALLTVSVVVSALIACRLYCPSVPHWQYSAHAGGAGLRSAKHDSSVDGVQIAHTENLEFQFSENVSKSVQETDGDTRLTRPVGLNASQWLLYWKQAGRFAKMIGQGVTFPDLLEQKPQQFLKDYKNPCWSDSAGNGLQCQPYFYLVGEPKTGTWDLYNRIAAHPEYAPGAKKETHWINRGRFSGDITHQCFTYYVDRYFGAAAKKIKATADHDNYHWRITGDCSVSSLFDNDYWPLLSENRGRTEPIHTNSDFIYHLNPNTKIIISLRNPIERLYSDFLFFTNDASYKLQTAFHTATLEAVQRMNHCLETRSNRSCTYDPTLQSRKKGPVVRLRIGMYHVHVQDVLRVFPRDQVHIVRLEDRVKDHVASMDKIFQFLGMSTVPLADSHMAKINSSSRANVRSPDDVKLGGMLEATRDVLYEFYRPHNKRLADLLNDDSFNYGRS